MYLIVNIQVFKVKKNVQNKNIICTFYQSKSTHIIIKRPMYLSIQVVNISQKLTI